LFPPAPGCDQKPLAETATASVTTDGDGDAAIGETSSNEVTNGEGQGTAARNVIGQMLEFSGKEAGCDRVREVGSRGGSYDSSTDGVYDCVNGVGGLDDEDGVTSGMECFVQIRNATTGRDLRVRTFSLNRLASTSGGLRHNETVR